MKTKLRLSRHLIAASIAGLAMVAAPRAEAAGDVMFVLDSSGSMWAQINGKNKVVHAREALAEMFERYQGRLQLGISSFGHSGGGGCNGPRTVVALGNIDPAAYGAALKRTIPAGTSPVARSLRQAAESLAPGETPRTIILLADSDDACGRNACEVAREIAGETSNLTIEVIGFRVADAADQQQLSCIATETGGAYLSAATGADLKASVARAFEAAAERAGIASPQTTVADAATGGPEVVAEGGAENPPLELDPARMERLPKPIAKPERFVDRAPAVTPDTPPGDATTPEETSIASAEPANPSNPLPAPPLDITGSIEPAPQAAPPKPVPPAAKPDTGVPAIAAKPEAIKPEPKSRRQQQAQPDPELTTAAIEPIAPKSVPPAAKPEAARPKPVKREPAKVAPPSEVNAKEKPKPADNARDVARKETQTAGKIEPPAPSRASDPATGLEVDDGDNDDRLARLEQGPNAPTAGVAVAPEFIVAREAADTSSIKLTAQLARTLEPIRRPLNWKVYQIEPSQPDKWIEVAATVSAQTTLELEPGEYVVRATYGLAGASKIVSVKENSLTAATFILNAGALRVLPSLVALEAPVGTSVEQAVFDDREDSASQKPMARLYKPGGIFLLNAGEYRLESRFGDANAVVTTKIGIKPGRLTEVEVNHKAAIVDFRLTDKTSGKPIDSATWQLVDGEGRLIIEASGKAPVNTILAPGNYTVTAQVGAKSYSNAFEISAGETRDVEIVMP